MLLLDISVVALSVLAFVIFDAYVRSCKRI